MNRPTWAEVPHDYREYQPGVDLCVLCGEIGGHALHVPNSESVECDFCGGPTTRDDLTILPVGRFEIPHVIANFSWGWGACPACKPHLVACNEAGDKEAIKAALEALVEHALAEHRKRDGRATSEAERLHFRIAYSGLFIHQNGPLRKWEPELDDREDES